jgi:hypothetical protein
MGLWPIRRNGSQVAVTPRASGGPRYQNELDSRPSASSGQAFRGNDLTFDEGSEASLDFLLAVELTPHPAPSADGLAKAPSRPTLCRRGDRGQTHFAMRSVSDSKILLGVGAFVYASG